jgi:hypothetical protein
MAFEKGNPHAAKGAAKSVAVRQAKKELMESGSPKELAAAQSAEMMDILIRAAKGTGAFQDLELPKRIAAAQTVLAYGIGKPATQKSEPPEEEEEEIPMEVSEMYGTEDE